VQQVHSQEKFPENTKNQAGTSDLTDFLCSTQFLTGLRLVIVGKQDAPGVIVHFHMTSYKSNVELHDKTSYTNISLLFLISV